MQQVDKRALQRLAFALGLFFPLTLAWPAWGSSCDARPRQDPLAPGPSAASLGPVSVRTFARIVAAPAWRVPCLPSRAQQPGRPDRLSLAHPLSVPDTAQGTHRGALPGLSNRPADVSCAGYARGLCTLAQRVRRPNEASDRVPEQLQAA
jgi:hypothetical protein